MDSKNIPHSENKTFEDEYREREQAQLPEELESKLSSLLEEYRERISPYSLDFAEKYFRHLGSSIIDADMNKPERELFTKEALEKLYESTRFDLEQCLRQKL